MPRLAIPSDVYPQRGSRNPFFSGIGKSYERIAATDRKRR
jgi:hypothetical protein